VQKRVCSFCGGEIEYGTGKMLVKRDGTVHLYCGSKCQKNHALKRIPRHVSWTSAARK